MVLSGEENGQNGENDDTITKLVAWSTFDFMDKSQIDDTLALICTDMQVPLQKPKYITSYTPNNGDLYSDDTDTD